MSSTEQNAEPSTRQFPSKCGLTAVLVILVIASTFK